MGKDYFCDHWFNDEGTLNSKQIMPWLTLFMRRSWLKHKPVFEKFTLKCFSHQLLKTSYNSMIFHSYGVQGWPWTWLETLETNPAEQPVWSRERLPPLVRGDLLTVSRTRIHQPLQYISIVNLFLWINPLGWFLPYETWGSWNISRKRLRKFQLCQKQLI